MPTVAEQLRIAREAHGLTVHQVAEITKIKTEHVRALETGDYQIFAAPVYIRGFTRTYGRLLHLDVEDLASALETELSQAGFFPEPSSAVPHRHGVLDELMLHFSTVNWRIVLPLIGLTVLLVVIILGYRSYTARQTRDPLSDLGPGQYQPSNGQPLDTLPLPSTNRP
jgi:cytoskeleton protein RodZ